MTMLCTLMERVAGAFWHEPRHGSFETNTGKGDASRRLRSRAWGRSKWWGETGQLPFGRSRTIQIQELQAGATEVLQDNLLGSGRFGSSMTMIAVAAGGFFLKWHGETTCGDLCLPSISAVTAACMFCRKTVRKQAVTSASRHLPWPCGLCPSSLSSSIQRPYTHRLDFSLLFDFRRPLLLVFLLLKQFLLRFKAVLIDCLRAPTRRSTVRHSSPVVPSSLVAQPPSLHIIGFNSLHRTTTLLCRRRSW